jgi:excisionase family DNA binding protein
VLAAIDIRRPGAISALEVDLPHSQAPHEASRCDGQGGDLSEQQQPSDEPRSVIVIHPKHGWPVIGPSHPDGVVSPYFTAAEAATYLRTTVQGIYSLVKRGRLKPMPGSGKLLFTQEALDESLKKRRR